MVDFATAPAIAPATKDLNTPSVRRVFRSVTARLCSFSAIASILGVTNTYIASLVK